MKTRYKIIIVGIVLTAIVFGTYQSLMIQCETLSVFMETPRNPNLWSCLEIWGNQSKQPDINSELEFAQKLKNARDTLYENQDTIPWTGLGVSTSEKAVTISIDDENPEDYREIIEELVGSDIPVIIKKGGNPFIDSENISDVYTDEQIDRIFKRCDYQKKMDERNWIGLDGNKIRDHQPQYVWENSTHYLDNNACEWQERK